MLRGTDRTQPHMNSLPTPRNEENLCLLNRDHIISISQYRTFDRTLWI